MLIVQNKINSLSYFYFQKSNLTKSLDNTCINLWVLSDFLILIKMLSLISYIMLRIYFYLSVYHFLPSCVRM